LNFVDTLVHTRALKLNGPDDNMFGILCRYQDEENYYALVIGSDGYYGVFRRAARQGDPGSSRFYLSLEDDLMRLFGSDRIAGIMSKMGLEEGEEMTHPLLNRAIVTAQKRVEGHNFSIREQVLKYDDIINKQREEIYAFRNNIIDSSHPRRGIMAIIEEVVEEKVIVYCPEGIPPRGMELAGSGVLDQQYLPPSISIPRNGGKRMI